MISLSIWENGGGEEVGRGKRCWRKKRRKEGNMLEANICKAERKTGEKGHTFRRGAPTIVVAFSLQRGGPTIGVAFLQAVTVGLIPLAIPRGGTSFPDVRHREGWVFLSVSVSVSFPNT
jgi:hypothetical protein